MDAAREAAHRGLLKLMLRLPSFRGQLHLLWQNDVGLEALCEAYEDATATLERLLRKSDVGEEGLIDEYRAVCLELESDVRSRCLSRLARSR